MKREIIPAILSYTAQEAHQKIKLVEPFVRWIQLDVMDGKFVPNKTWADPREIKKWRVRTKIELHLMVRDPAVIVHDWLRVTAFKRVIWHVEATIDHEALIARCKRRDLQVGLALSPGTSVTALKPYLKTLDVVLILGVNPGWSGQKLIRSTLKKIDQMKKHSPRVQIEFDGGVSEHNLLTLGKRGVNGLCMGSAIFKQKNPAAFIKKQQRRLKTIA